VGPRSERAFEDGQREDGEDVPSPLGYVAYDRWRGELSLHTFVESDVDHQLDEFLAGYAGLEASTRRSVRDSLTTDDFETLLAYAKRRALVALRTRDAAAARDGLAALTAIDAERVDHRDVVVAAALVSYASSSVNADSREPRGEPVRVLARLLAAARTTASNSRAKAVQTIAFREASARAEQGVAEILRQFARKPAGSLASWGFRQVETGTGPVLFEDRGERYEPTTELTEIALDIAAVLEADSYQVTGIALGGELPADWLGGGDQQDVARARATLAGCVALNAELRPAAHPTAASQLFVVFLAEAASAEDAATLVQAASSEASPPRDVLALQHEQLCCIAIARSFVESVASFERPGALGRFRPALASLLSRGTRAGAR
jgi:hypothetical protein